LGGLFVFEAGVDVADEIWGQNVSKRIATG
jgi:hypothetical protein